MRTEILKRDPNIAKLNSELSETKSKITKYQKKVNEENLKHQKKLDKAIKEGNRKNENFMSQSNNIRSEITKLAEDVKISTESKEKIQYDVFLSHSSKDKDSHVSKLSFLLSKKGLEVFEDVKIFRMGDSQSRTMDKGILSSRFAVIFLSKNFIDGGWTDYEFRSFLNQEISQKRVIILPIWHDVSVEDVREYNPYLADKFALQTSKMSIEEMANDICDVIQESKE